MKVGNEFVGKVVYVRLRVGGSYTGTILSTGSTVTLLMHDNRKVMVQSSMIASMQLMGDVKNE